ncbi:hypothetical protein OROHE_013205 [Orobanche hederae]
MSYFAFLICCILTIHKAEATARTEASLAHCENKCGQTQIPYPFRVGKGCYLEKSFEITCNHSTGYATIGDSNVDAISVSSHSLRATGFSVLNLSYNISRERGYAYNFSMNTDNHYDVSRTKNAFIKCCQMSLSKDARRYELNTEALNTMTKSWKCGFFTLLDKDFPLNKLDFSACKDTYESQVIVEWYVGDRRCEEAKAQQDYACGHNTECVNMNTRTGYTCKCLHGFKGNPYLLEGCKDIDECANHKYYYCPMQTHSNWRCCWYSDFSSCWHLNMAKVSNDESSKNKAEILQEKGGLLLEQQIASGGANLLLESTLFKIEELEKATNQFNESRVLGKGGLGTVYKGMLPDGRIVAVKKANIADQSQVGQFINEVCILSQLSHRHIVRLLGCCLETDVPLLIYEYVSNGTLSHHIHNEPNTPQMSWEVRLRIAAEVAEALAYLHSYASTAIFHRDIKSSNILLDEKYRAVVSDFGISRSVPTDRTHLTTLVGGTFGYIDPEYFRSGQLNDKSDVYAFGVRPTEKEKRASGTSRKFS